MLSYVWTTRDGRVIVVDLGELNVQTDQQSHSTADSGDFSHSVCGPHSVVFVSELL